MYCAQLPAEVHLRDIIDRTMKTPRIPICLRNCPIPGENPEAFQGRVYCCVCRVGLHEHRFTCAKPPKARHWCRLCYPRGLKNKNGPVQLIPNPHNDTDDKTQPVFTVLPNIQAYRHPSERNILEEPIPVIDNRVIVWEIERPEISR